MAKTSQIAREAPASRHPLSDRCGYAGPFLGSRDVDGIVASRFEISCLCVADNDNASPVAGIWPLAIVVGLTGPALAAVAVAALLLSGA